MPYDIDSTTTTSDALLRMMRSVTGEVLETMFFSEAVPVNCEHHPAKTDDWISARVRFEGEPSGDLHVMLSRKLAHSIAAGFLGADPEDVNSETDGQVGCELSNIVCGAILSRLHPDSRVSLRPPGLTFADFGEGGGVHQCFETPEGMLAVTMRIGE